MMKASVVSIAALALAWGAPAAAKSVIYDLSATSGNFYDVAVKGGQTYRLEWIGRVDGGLFDSANNCGTANCSSTWNNGVTFIEPPPPNGGNFELNIYSIFGPSGAASFSSAAQALAAYKSGANITHLSRDFVGSVPVGPVRNEGLIPNPALLTPPQDLSVRIAYWDSDRNASNNYGGVSLRITAVPEPSIWSVMIVGFGLAGAVLRRRAGSRVSLV
jgi:PEP-CTERM motif